MTHLPPFATTPMPHQAAEFGWYRTAGRGLWWSMRTGKSKAAIDTACAAWWEFEITLVVIVAPKGVHLNWIRYEWPKHAWCPWVGAAWVSEYAGFPWHREALVAAVEAKGILGVLALNNDALTMERPWNLLRYAMDRHSIMLITDEAHHFRDPTSARSRRLRAFRSRCHLSRVLTGTPVGNSATGLWSLLELIRPGCHGHRDFQAFRNRYFLPVTRPAGPNRNQVEWELRNDRVPELVAAQAPHVSVLTRADCPWLSRVTVTRRYVDLTPEQAAAYGIIRNDAAAAEAKFGISVVEATSRLTKLQQVLSGFVLDGQKQVKDIMNGKPLPRLEALLDVLRLEGAPAVVWCRFREDIARVAAFLRRKGYAAVEYHGDVSTTDRGAALDRLRQGGNAVLVGQPGAGGEGLDMTTARTVVWYSHTFKAVERDQASERCTGIDDRTVNMTDLCTLGTVDETILDCLGKAHDVADVVAGSGLRAFIGNAGFRP